MSDNTAESVHGEGCMQVGRRLCLSHLVLAGWFLYVHTRTTYSYPFFARLKDGFQLPTRMHGQRVTAPLDSCLFQAEGARLAFAGFMIQGSAHHQASQGLALTTSRE